MNNYLLNPNKEDVNKPPILYKYRYWSNELHKKTLKKNEFYLAPFSSFNSRHEHNLPTDYESVTDDILWHFFYKTAETEFNITGHQNKVQFANHWVKNTPGKNKDHQKWVEKKYREIIDKKRGVLSFSSDRDNLELWDTFSLLSSGFVVGLDSDFLFAGGNPIGMFSPVHYYKMDEIPKIKALRSLNSDDPIEDGIKFINSLPDIYKHEREFRLSKVLTGSSRKLHINRRYFKEVILGHYMPNNCKLEIIEIVNRRFPGCKLYQQFVQDDFMVCNPF